MGFSIVKVVGGGVMLLAVGYGCLLGALYAGQRALLFPGGFLPLPSDPAALPPGVQTTEVVTPDGVTLRTLWKSPRPGCGIVVTFHGNGSYPDDALLRFAAGPWARNGWGVLAIAYRGYPGSTGAPSEVGVIRDGVAALAEARRRAPKSPILLHGHSLGAAVAIAVAEQDGSAAPLYLEAPFASILDIARTRYWFVPVSLLLRDPFRSDLRIGHVRGPIVIVHGLSDDVVPVAEGRRLAAAAPAGTTFDAVAGDHVSILGARDATFEPLFQRRIGGCPAA